jgi:nicotinate-nucleotide pyrophosphorylase (carboxylating)
MAGPPLEFDSIYDFVNEALDEDIGRGDITSRAVVRRGLRARGSFMAKQDLVLAGLEVADAVFSSFDYGLQIESSTADGELLSSGKIFARITGDAHALLAGERVALNFLQHMSGIATFTRRFVDAVAGTSATIVDTRKTVPGLRMLEKYAVTAGGGRNHRLWTMMAYHRDNHRHLRAVCARQSEERKKAPDTCTRSRSR